VTVRILHGDCFTLLKTLPDESVHCVVTSPPYWGLRDYAVPASVWGGLEGCSHVWGPESLRGGPGGGQGATSQREGRSSAEIQGRRGDSLGQWCQLCQAWRGALGLEPTPFLYVEHLVAVFREARRVLRSDGTLWLNLGDSYATGTGDVGRHRDEKRRDNGRPFVNGRGEPQSVPTKNTVGPMTQPNRMPIAGLKPKDLIMMPARVALALQADGWYLRQDIIWSKPNPMPESVRDRCTKAHEYLFLLAKGESYYYDADAIAEPAVRALEAKYDDSQNGLSSSESHAGQGSSTRKFRLPSSGNLARKPASARGVPIDTGGSSAGAVAGSIPWEGISRNKRSVWTVPSKPFKEAHFATFPPALIEPCILAGCPAQVCAVCRAPWIRRVELGEPDKVTTRGQQAWTAETGQRDNSGGLPHRDRRTEGFSPSCDCSAQAVGGTVLDPFGGAGTTGLVADRLQRDAILLELNPEYVAMAERRIRHAGMHETRPLFSEANA
jgi:DNA modification methylase